MVSTEAPQEPAPWQLLHAIAAAVPLPCGLFDTRGRVLWLSRMAAVSLGVEGARAHRDSGLPRTSAPPLFNWRRLARTRAREQSESGGNGHERRQPGQSPGVPRLRAWVLPALEGGEPLVFIAQFNGAHEPGHLPDRGSLRRLGLTAREIDVLALMIQGFTVLNAAHLLGIAEATVTTHLKHVYRKLGVSNRAELALRVLFGERQRELRGAEQPAPPT